MGKVPKRSEPAKTASSTNAIREGLLSEIKGEEQSEAAARPAGTQPETGEAELRGAFFRRPVQAALEQAAEPPPTEDLAGTLEKLAEMFQSRKTGLVSILEAWGTSDDEDRAALEKLSIHYANRSLLEAQRTQEQALMQLLAAADKRETNQLNALQAAIEALRTKIQELERADSAVVEEIRNANARRTEVIANRERAFGEFDKADKALAETVLSILKKAIDMRPAQPKPADAKPGPVLKPLGDKDATAAGEAADMLRLQKRTVEFDRKVLQAIEVVAKSSRKWRLPVLNALREWGLSTKVEQVVRTLDRRRLTDIRRQVLDAALPAILAGLINDKGRDAFAKMARDTVSLADEIISRLDRPDGPVDEVVKDVAVRAIKERGLEDSKANRTKLENYLRLSFDEPRA